MARKFSLWIAFALPIAYVGIILAVVIHEVVGHGVTAVVSGGVFEGFVVYPDGGGFAAPNATPPVRIRHGHSYAVEETISDLRRRSSVERVGRMTSDLVPADVWRQMERLP